MPPAHASQNADDECYWCGRKGHRMNACFYKKQFDEWEKAKEARRQAAIEKAAKKDVNMNALEQQVKDLTEKSQKVTALVVSIVLSHRDLTSNP